MAHTSLGKLVYLSALKYVDGIVGNSSSGLIEGPSFKIGTINIGDRQKGRIRAESVIDCQPDYPSIISALDRLFSNEFKETLPTVRNPYGAGGAAEAVLESLRVTPLDGLVQKSFFERGFEQLKEIYNSGETLIVLGPGFSKEDFIRTCKEKDPEIINKYKTDTVGQGGMNGINEALKSGKITNKMETIELEKELTIMEELKTSIYKDFAT